MSPEALDLLDEAAATLREQLAKQATGEARYLALLAANAVATARREAVLWPRLERARAALPENAAAAIRAGEHDDDPALHEALMAEAALRAWIADPSTLTEAERAAHLEEATP